MLQVMLQTAPWTPQSIWSALTDTRYLIAIPASVSVFVTCDAELFTVDLPASDGRGSSPSVHQWVNPLCDV